MGEKEDRYISTLEQQVDQLQREVQGFQMTIYFMLMSQPDQTIEVSNEIIVAGLEDGKVISIEEDPEREVHVFKIIDTPVEETG